MVALTNKIQLKKPDDGEYGWSQMLRDNHDTLDAITGLLRDERMLSGISTGGSSTTLIDTTLAMGIDAMKGASVIIRRGNQILRVETVLSNTATTFTFATGVAIQLGDGYIVANQAISQTLAQLGAEPASPNIQAHITSLHAPVAAQANRPQATVAQAQAGIDTATDMSPARVAEAIAALGLGIGSGQVWQNVLASRAASVTYTNTTGRAIMVSVSGSDARPDQYWGIILTVDGVNVCDAGGFSNNYHGPNNVQAIVPNGSTYSITPIEPAYDVIVIWAELR